MTPLTNWLLDGPAWVQYRTRIDLLKQKENHPDVLAARTAMLADPQIKSLVKAAAALPSTVINSHKSAGHPLHQLVFLADIGLHADDPGIDTLRVMARILKHCSPEGPFQVLMNIPKHFGGSGKDGFAWALCDAPLVVYALVKFGLGDDARVQAAAQYLIELVRDNGFPCAVSKELGKFRGPGRKDDPCPYANLVMLRLLAQDARWRKTRAAKTAVATLLDLWTHSREQHPYIFYMGDDFRKLKAPLVWYDILHVVDVLTQFPHLRRDPRLRAMIDCVRAQADKQGRLTPASVWQAWGDWEFGQKKIPSRWVTLVAHRAFMRIE